MKTISCLIITVIVSILCISCSKEPEKETIQQYEMEGIVFAANFGCGLGIGFGEQSGGGIIPVNLPVEFQQVGLKVKVRFEYTGETITCGGFLMNTKKAKIINIQKIPE